MHMFIHVHCTCTEYVCTCVHTCTCIQCITSTKDTPLQTQTLPCSDAPFINVIIPLPQAKALMKRVDNLSLGMSGPADALIISAASQDPALLEDHARNMKGLASTLQTVAMDSVAGLVVLGQDRRGRGRS